MVYLFNLKTLFYIFVSPFICIFLIVWWVNSFENLLISLSLSLTITTVIFVLLNMCWKWLWKIVPILDERIFPDISGKWDMEIRWRISCEKCAKDAAESGQSMDGQESGVALIDQNLFNIDITAETDEANSETLIAQPKKEKGRSSLYYVYRNTRKATGGKRNTTHEGAVILHIDPNCKTKMEGNYYTGRCTAGRVIFTRVQD